MANVVRGVSEPPRASISVFKPVMAPDVQLSRADSSLLQAGACLSQPANKEQFDVSAITSYHTQSLDARQILNILPPAPSHTIGSTEVARPPQPISNYTSLHGTSLPSVSPQQHTHRSGDTVLHMTSQNSPSPRPEPIAVAEAIPTKPQPLPDNQPGLTSTSITQCAQTSQHTSGPLLQTSVGVTSRQLPPTAVTPVTQLQFLHQALWLLSRLS